MVKIEISEELLMRIRAFKKVVDTVLGEPLPGEGDYIELVLVIGLERMLQDVLPKNDILRNTMVLMFRENPEYVSDFISRVLKRGELIQKEEEERLRSVWRSYIV